MPSPESSLSLPPDVHALLRAFCARSVRFVVVGAHAQGYWGQPRATGDFDLFIDPTPENARRVLDSLIEFGVPLADLTLDDLATPGIVFQMGAPPYRIDLATELTGIGFEEAWEAHGRVEIEGLVIPIIGREAMVKNKRATGRPKDLLDLEMLGEG